MQTVTMEELQVGWWGLFDPIYGPEKVIEIDGYALGPNERGARVIGTSNESGTWPIIRFRVSDERGESPTGRYIARFPQEPVLAMTFPDLPVEVRAGML